MEGRERERKRTAAAEESRRRREARQQPTVTANSDSHVCVAAPAGSGTWGDAVSLYSLPGPFPCSFPFHFIWRSVASRAQTRQREGETEVKMRQLQGLEPHVLTVDVDPVRGWLVALSLSLWVFSLAVAGMGND
jgi:hypothetical protein